MKAHIYLHGKLVHTVFSKEGETVDQLFARAYDSVTIAVVSEQGSTLKQEDNTMRSTNG